MQLRKLLLQLIRCAKRRRKLNVLYGQLNVVVLLLKKRSNMLLIFKLKESSRKQLKHYVIVESYL